MNDNKIKVLFIEDVCELTGWCEATTRKIFASEEEFPAITIGKKYFVEQEALRNFFSKRRGRTKQ